jgi:hypothetical protein
LYISNIWCISVVILIVLASTNNFVNNGRIIKYTVLSPLLVCYPHYWSFDTWVLFKTIMVHRVLCVCEFGVIHHMFRETEDSSSRAMPKASRVHRDRWVPLNFILNGINHGFFNCFGVCAVCAVWVCECVSIHDSQKIKSETVTCHTSTSKFRVSFS